MQASVTSDVKELQPDGNKGTNGSSTIQSLGSILRAKIRAGPSEAIIQQYWERIVARLEEAAVQGQKVVFISMSGLSLRMDNDGHLAIIEALLDRAKSPQVDIKTTLVATCNCAYNEVCDPQCARKNTFKFVIDG